AVLFSRSPRHPTPTLFPYTTLFRSTTGDMTRFLLSLDDAVDTIFAGVRTGKRGDLYIPRVPSAKVVDIAAVLIGNRPIETKVIRSEEHTSELQSLRHLVCRLLLEKK